MASFVSTTFRLKRPRRTTGATALMVSVLACAMVLAMSAFGHAQTSEWDQRTACMGDALRLCSAEIPDRQKIMACMAARHGQLTPRCVVVFDANMRALQQQHQ